MMMIGIGCFLLLMTGFALGWSLRGGTIDTESARKWRAIWRDRA